MATLVELVCLVERATLETLDYLDALETEVLMDHLGRMALLRSKLEDQDSQVVPATAELATQDSGESQPCPVQLDFLETQETLRPSGLALAVCLDDLVTLELRESLEIPVYLECPDEMELLESAETAETECQADPVTEEILAEGGLTG